LNNPSYADRLFRVMPTTCSGNMASSSSRTPESVVALVWTQWTTSPELMDDFIGIRSQNAATSTHESVFKAVGGVGA
jgi:hypothetical protein